MNGIIAVMNLPVMPFQQSNKTKKLEFFIRVFSYFIFSFRRFPLPVLLFAHDFPSIPLRLLLR